MKRFLAPISALMALHGAAVAQSAAVLGRDDADFARKLLDAGYAELADGLCQLIEKTGQASADDIVAVQSLRLDIRMLDARAEPDAVKRRELYETLLADKEKFVEEHGNTPEGRLTQETLPDVYAALGDAITDMLKTEQDPTKLAELRATGSKIFEKAEQQLNGRIFELDEQLALLDPNAPEYEELDGEKLLAMYNLAKTFYYHGQGDPQGMGGYYLDKAIDAFLEISLDYADTIYNYQGYVFMGLAHKAKGEHEDALLDFDDAISLREWLEPGPDGRYPLQAGDADLVAWATQQKVLLLKELQRYEDAIAAADDYLGKTIDPLGKSTAVNEYGCRVLALKAECQKLNGDMQGCMQSANVLVEFDPQGPWGNLGREIVGGVAAEGGAGAVPAAELLKIAGSLLEAGSWGRAITICQLARDQSVGTTDEAEVSSRAYYMMGIAFERQDLLHEATVAYEASFEGYPSASAAVEGLYNAVDVYQALSAKERRAVYRTRYQELRRLLAERYPDHPLATRAQLLEGQELEDDRKYKEAADFYLRVPASSPNYAASRFRAGRCLWELGREADANKDADAARTSFDAALTHLAEARKSAAEGMSNSLNEAQNRNFALVDYDALSLIARIELKLGKANEVLKMLDAAQQQYADDPESMGQLYSLRVQTLDELDRVDEAVELLEGLLLKDKSAPGVAAAAGALARSLDTRAAKLLQENSADPKIDDLWRKAARYYVEQSRQLLAQNRISASVAEGMAGRLQRIGIRLNGIPDDRITFIGWSGLRGAQTELWEEAVSLYRASLAQAPSYQASVQLGRTYGFLGRWSDAAPVYAALFDQERVYDRETKRFDTRLLQAKPELFLAYLEWGVVEHLAGVEGNDQARMLRANDIVQAVNASTKPDDANALLWWWSKVYLIRNLFELGDYQMSDVAMRDLERRTNRENWAKFGVDTALEELKKQIATKIR